MAPPKLITNPQAHAARLRLLLARIAAGRHVQNRDIAKVLSEPRRQAFCKEIRQPASAHQPGTQLPAYPDELDGYFALVEQGTQTYARAERAKKRPEQSKRLHADAVTLFQRAQEALGEIIDSAAAHQSSAIEAWLDRTITRSEVGQIDFGLDPQSVPRKRGSRSRYAETKSSPKMLAGRLRYIKEGYLEEELAALQGVQPAQDPAETLKALRKLAALVRR